MARFVSQSLALPLSYFSKTVLPTERLSTAFLSTTVISKALLSTALCASIALFSSQASAQISVDQALPKVSIEKDGELMLKDSKVQYQSWNSDQLTGKVYLIQHMAGRSSAKEINDPLIERIKMAGFDREKYSTVTVVNTDDAIWGTSGFVSSKLEGNKEKYPWSIMVLDKEGVARDIWQLEKKSSAIIVLDQNQQVRWFKDGKLSEQEQRQVMQLLEQLQANNLQ